MPGDNELHAEETKEPAQPLDRKAIENPLSPKEAHTRHERQVLHVLRRLQEKEFPSDILDNIVSFLEPSRAFDLFPLIGAMQRVFFDPSVKNTTKLRLLHHYPDLMQTRFWSAYNSPAVPPIIKFMMAAQYASAIGYKPDDKLVSKYLADARPESEPLLAERQLLLRAWGWRAEEVGVAPQEELSKEKREAVIAGLAQGNFSANKEYFDRLSIPEQREVISRLEKFDLNNTLPSLYNYTVNPQIRKEILISTAVSVHKATGEKGDSYYLLNALAASKTVKLCQYIDFEEFPNINKAIVVLYTFRSPSFPPQEVQEYVKTENSEFLEKLVHLVFEFPERKQAYLEELKQLGRAQLPQRYTQQLGISESKYQELCDIERSLHFNLTDPQILGFMIGCYTRLKNEPRKKFDPESKLLHEIFRAVASLDDISPTLVEIMPYFVKSLSLEQQKTVIEGLKEVWPRIQSGKYSSHNISNFAKLLRQSYLAFDHGVRLELKALVLREKALQKQLLHHQTSSELSSEQSFEGLVMEVLTGNAAMLRFEERMNKLIDIIKTLQLGSDAAYPTHQLESITVGKVREQIEPLIKDICKNKSHSPTTFFSAYLVTTHSAQKLVEALTRMEGYQLRKLLETIYNTPLSTKEEVETFFKAVYENRITAFPNDWQLSHNDKTHVLDIPKDRQVLMESYFGDQGVITQLLKAEKKPGWSAGIFSKKNGPAKTGIEEFKAKISTETAEQVRTHIKALESELKIPQNSALHKALEQFAHACESSQPLPKPDSAPSVG